MLPRSKKRGKKYVRNSPASTKVREEGGEEVLQVQEQRFPYSPWRGPRWSRYPHYSPWRTLWWSKWTFPEGTVACREPTLEQVYPEGLYPVGGTPHQSRGKCEDEGVAERNCYGLTTTTIPHPPCAIRGGGGRGVGNEGVKLGKRRGGGQVF